ncbi:MAG TPA: DUF2298 domain-containing protein, partial [Candidatus Nitrosocosmicus sp.]|nr:DUF2298 domain-containing protein [Candidatus Nitrosocosmicus sp.]
MNWLSQSLWWYLILLGIGLLSYPITRKLFPKFYDHGYPFAKTISIIIISYAIFLLSTLKLLPFTQESLLLIVFILAVINFFIFRKEKFKRPQLIFILGEELLFLFSFLFWVIVRGQEPAIHGLEKFMDFGFMNSIGRTTYFPPLDMWLSGHTINYYYFGHLTGAVLTKLSGFASYISYNLILDTIFALAITQTFSLCMNLVYKSFGKIQFGIIGGILGTFIVNLAGNFHTIYLFTKGYPNENPIPFWKIFSWFNPEKYWYPNATRFIPFTIHEFPIYSYVVADLHGHVFDIPFVLLTLAILFNLFHSYKEKVVPVLESKVAQEKSQNYNLKKKSKKKTDSNFPEKKAITESGFDIKTYLISNRYSLIFTIIL